jgi:hypothetical protein
MMCEFEEFEPINIYIMNDVPPNGDEQLIAALLKRARLVFGLLFLAYCIIAVISFTR